MTKTDGIQALDNLETYSPMTNTTPQAKKARAKLYNTIIQKTPLIKAITKSPRSEVVTHILVLSEWFVNKKLVLIRVNIKLNVLLIYKR